jgi:hypothetical protein
MVGLWVQTRKVDYLRVSYIYLEYRAVYQIHRDNLSKTRNKNRISPELIELEYEMERLFQHLSQNACLYPLCGSISDSSQMPMCRFTSLATGYPWQIDITDGTNKKI